MAIVLNTNVPSLKVQSNLTNATNSMNEAMTRLTTGLRINTAADDAAGLVISKGLETQIRGSDVAKQNCQTGANLLQTAEGTLSVIQDHFSRMRDLTLQAMNGGQGVAEVAALEDEILARLEEIDRLSEVAAFNDFELFHDDNTTVVLQVGDESSEVENTIAVDNIFIPARVSVLTGRDTAVAPINFIDPGTGEIVDRTSFESILDDFSAAIDEISARRGDIGAIQNRLESTVSNLTIQNEES